MSDSIEIISWNGMYLQEIKALEEQIPQDLFDKNYIGTQVSCWD